MLTPGRSNFHKTVTEEKGQLLAQHANYLMERFELGEIIFAGPSVEENEDHFGIVVLEVEDKERAKEIMNADPAVKHGILKSHVTQFSVFLMRDKVGNG